MCPFEKYHYKDIGFLVEDIDDKTGITEAYRCNCCGLTWATNYAKNEMWRQSK